MGNKKQTSPKAASAASKVLRDKRTSKASKTAAASALAQTPKRKKWFQHHCIHTILTVCLNGLYRFISFKSIWSTSTNCKSVSAVINFLPQSKSLNCLLFMPICSATNNCFNPLSWILFRITFITALILSVLKSFIAHPPTQNILFP